MNTRSGASRCSFVVNLYSCYHPPGGARRWHQHRGRGVVPLVGLGCWESLGRDGGAGDAVGVSTDLDAEARLRVSQ